MLGLQAKGPVLGRKQTIGRSRAKMDGSRLEIQTGLEEGGRLVGWIRLCSTDGGTMSESMMELGLAPGSPWDSQCLGSGAGRS